MFDKSNVKASSISSQLLQHSSLAKQETMKRFFKTEKGGYAENDFFLGITVPEVRKIAKYNNYISLEEIIILLKSKIHEERLISLYFLIQKYNSGDSSLKETIFNIYISNTKHINNWDLIDTSCEHIVGDFLKDKPKNVLFDFARSQSIWEKRIAIVSTFYFIKQKEHKLTFKIADILISDNHDLIHKAVGWMIREVGKKCGEDYLIKYLDKNSAKMSRTTLRYSIEKLDEQKRLYYLNKDKRSNR